MIKYLAKNFGLTALGLCLLTASVEIHDTYKAYTDHEASKFAEVHRAYAQALSHSATIERLASAIDTSQLAPAVTLKKINARAR